MPGPVVPDPVAPHPLPPRPLVSVVIPTYNQAAYLREAIDSVLAQTYPDIECIVVDDGSTDGTADILATYGDRITSFRQPNRGAAVALNVGLRAARGELICWLSSDDAYLPAKVERQVEALRLRPDAGLCCTGWESMDAAGSTLRQHADSTWVHEDALVAVFWRNPINGTTVMLPRPVLDEVGLFDEQIRADVDGDMWMRIAAIRPVIVVPGILARYRVHSAAQSRDLVLMRASKARVRRARLGDGSLVARVRAVDGRAAPRVLAWIGRDMVREGLPGLGASLLVASLRTGLAPAEQFELALALAVAATPPVLRQRSRRRPPSLRRIAAGIPGARRLVRALRRRSSTS